ncbi:hypothetical protein FRB95_000967 [Tulasnella sp. JGI-2019a]|nr:hypothetical protein FRB95_000967 [Tulasnella sp. JGI-2019a]
MEEVAIKPNQAPPPAPWVDWASFSGGPSEDVLLFTRAVHRFAFTHYRHRDNDWMAAYAYGCLSGDALSWFEELERNVKQDWSKLQPAIVKKFPRNTATTTRSRVKVFEGSGKMLGYLGPLGRSSIHNRVAKAEEALVLDIPRNMQLVDRIRLTASSQAYPFIGLEAVLESATDHHWNFRACEAGQDGSSFKRRAQADADTPARPASSKIWTIKKPDDSTEELAVEWIDDTGAQISLRALTNTPPSNYVWLRATPRDTDTHLKLILERL